ncbi:hypothetical protein ACFV1W_13280 [Kitasatospora sp. NPDC059648]|uniref:hypothetical protein n=1 Tax=Kitasatospora sp. NPDC059648 TaxID=3346894 RepID=UPI0036D02F6F
MSAGSVVQRSWWSFTGRRPPLLPPTTGRGRAGYTLWQRFWASFIGLDLAPTRVGALLTQTAPSVVQRLPAREEPSRNLPGTGLLAPGRFQLPRLVQVGGLTAAGADAVLLEASSPDGSVRFLVRGHGTAPPGYSLELVLHRTDSTGPVMTAVGYAGADGTERLLLVPVVRGQFGPPASYVQLPDFTIGAAWTASVITPVSSDSSWDAATVAASVRASLNEATRDAWRQVRERVADDGLRAVIDGELQ